MPLVTHFDACLSYRTVDAFVFTPFAQTTWNILTPLTDASIDSMGGSDLTGESLLRCKGLQGHLDHLPITLRHCAGQSSTCASPVSVRVRV
ncbi:hypothetical protein [Pseudomonas sp. PDM31]|uniref:hypothetical protein n=1 Tax=Pseudomonas sp. PDM31 TaxID=2854778 RepID=UPI001C448884|nr:hypothetical protein [Pseudomonas sp. PDM31]MBV7479213.1 hypothetical protein [Pseudomonas sp. PDM31]